MLANRRRRCANINTTLSHCKVTSAKTDPMSPVSLTPTEPAAAVQRHLVNKCELHAAWTRVRPESADIAPRWGSAGRKVMTGVLYAQEKASPYSSPQTDYLNYFVVHNFLC